MASEAKSNVADHVVQTVETVATLHARAEKSVTAHQRVIERLTASMGRPIAVYVAVALIVTWIALNGLVFVAGGRPIDPPPFAFLSTFTSIAALITAMIVLTSQNRQARRAEQRAQLDLQVNLLAEQKTAKVIELLEELRRDLPIKDRVDPVADAMQETIDPAQVMEVFEQTLEASTDALAPSSERPSPTPSEIARAVTSPHIDGEVGRGPRSR